mgnify:CR=1 FL=1
MSEHEIFDELTSEQPARPAPRQRVRGGGGRLNLNARWVVAVLLAVVLLAGTLFVQSSSQRQAQPSASPSLAVPQGTVGGGESAIASPAPTGDGLTLGTNPNAVEARPSARASVVPIEAPVRQNPDRSDPEAVMKAWAVTWSWREKPNESARVAEWVEPDAFATAEPVVGVQAPFMVTDAQVLPRSKNQGIDTDFRKSRVVKVTVRDHRNVQVVLTWELTTLQDESGQWMVTDVSMTAWEGVPS